MFQINILLLSVLCSSQLIAQERNAAGQTIHTTKLELKLSGDIQLNDIVKIDNALSGYPEKIISHKYNAAKNRLFVFIAEKTNPIDILQVLKMNGITAGYRDEDNGYITLEPDGKTTRKLYFKE
ncbi:MAG: hypothetical protein ABI855_13330 [Bacteroidota bacterium]